MSLCLCLSLCLYLSLLPVSPYLSLSLCLCLSASPSVPLSLSLPLSLSISLCLSLCLVPLLLLLLLLYKVSLWVEEGTKKVGEEAQPGQPALDFHPARPWPQMKRLCVGFYSCGLALRIYWPSVFSFDEAARSYIRSFPRSAGHQMLTRSPRVANTRLQAARVPHTTYFALSK